MTEGEFRRSVVKVCPDLASGRCTSHILPMGNDDSHADEAEDMPLICGFFVAP